MSHAACKSPMPPASVDTSGIAVSLRWNFRGFVLSRRAVMFGRL